MKLCALALTALLTGGSIVAEPALHPELCDHAAAVRFAAEHDKSRPEGLMALRDDRLRPSWMGGDTSMAYYWVDTAGWQATDGEWVLQIHSDHHTERKVALDCRNGAAYRLAGFQDGDDLTRLPVLVSCMDANSWCGRSVLDLELDDRGVVLWDVEGTARGLERVALDWASKLTPRVRRRMVREVRHTLGAREYPSRTETVSGWEELYLVLDWDADLTIRVREVTVSFADGRYGSRRSRTVTEFAPYR